MKLLMILGGLMGFTIGIGFGLAQSSSWSSILWRASVAACLAGFLMRWWGRVWVECLQKACAERLAAPSPEPEPTPASPRAKS